MINAPWISKLLFSSVCVAMALVACGGSEDASGNGGGSGGQNGTGGATGPAATGGKGAAGGTPAGTGGATGGSATSRPTGGAPTGGTSSAAGGSSSTGGSSVTSGGTSGVAGSSSTSPTDVQQTCDSVCALLAGRTTPLACMPADCVGTCNSTYTKLYGAVPACGNDYLAMLKCGVNQPADSWSCFTASSGTTSISIPVPPSSAATDPCYSQFNQLYLTILGHLTACGGALQ